MSETMVSDRPGLLARRRTVTGIRFGATLMLRNPDAPLDRLAVAAFVAALCISCAQSPAQGDEPSKPARVIFDSDMSSDCDDVASLAVLHALTDEGKATILAVGASDRNKWAPLCMDAINTYYGHPEITIGTVKDRRV